MKIGFFGIKDADKKSFYQKNLTNHELFFIDSPITSNQIPTNPDFDIISIFVDCIIDQKVIDSLSNLKYITIRSTGFDNVDLNYTKPKNIKVSNVPSYGSHTVAEFTFSLILSLLRKTPEGIKRIKEENLFSYKNLRGFDLHSKTLGVIGTGKIGENVIKIAKGFEMKILANDKYPNKDLAKTLNFEYIELDRLLKESDVISLHAPNTKQTHHLINQNNIFKIKKGAFIVNTSRGILIDEQALISALDQKHIAGAALDVLEEEADLKENPKHIKSNPLLKYNNVLLTPHMAFYTKEAEDNIMQTTVDNINSFTKRSIKNLVN